MPQNVSYISEILLLHDRRSQDFRDAFGSSETAWRYTQEIPRVRQLVKVQAVMSEICNTPISATQLLVNPFVAWRHETWTYRDHVKRYCHQDGIILQGLASTLNLDYHTLRHQLLNPLRLQCDSLVYIATALNLSVDNLISEELSWKFGGKRAKVRRYSRVVKAQNWRK